MLFTFLFLIKLRICLYSFYSHRIYKSACALRVLKLKATHVLVMVALVALAIIEAWLVYFECRCDQYGHTKNMVMTILQWGITDASKSKQR